MQSLMSDQSVETRFLFRPHFFCPQAFQLVANDNATALHQMVRVCGAPTRVVDCMPVSLEGPLAILDRCDDPAKKHNEEPRIALKRLERFYNCNLPKLLAATEHVTRLLRINYDEFNHPSPVDCALCDVNIGSPWDLLKHVTSEKHLDKIISLGTSIDCQSHWHWNNLISSSNT
ncbi:hypothetical protein PENTCL1PPCAC_8061 [Pristionchus entomophagus]|uniref:C2H2-type domain-containing protein n=1 Tax=Pristionchus entomophagus TaxID=358040 RepID=A0AAV5SR83_9BILA|nr:hypothetical protein PENTCL1PPCAC_8061 [Pristionchus entomophagus]